MTIYEPKSDKAAKSELLSDIESIDRFYHSAKGALLASFLAPQLQALLRPAKGLDQIGFGYPFLAFDQGMKMPVLVPSEMGALSVADDTGVMTASVASDCWPLQTEFANQIIISHGLEYCYDPEACLNEAHRVLVSAGELILMVPNRDSLWARDDRWVFGHGQPYSKGQITKLLGKAGFEVTTVRRALHMPPVAFRLGMAVAKGTDRIGKVSWPMFSGVMIIQATKLRYATTGRKQALLRPALSPMRKAITQTMRYPSKVSSHSINKQASGDQS